MIQNMAPTHDNGLAGVAWDYNVSSIHVMKFDSIGQNEWRKKFTIPQHILRPGDIIELPNHDLMICGTIEKSPSRTYFILRTDSHGNVIYLMENSDSLLVSGAPDVMHFSGIASDGKVILAGIADTLSLGSGFLSKIDSTGYVDWTINFSASINTYFSSLRSRLLPDESIVVSGFCNQLFGGNQFCVMKFDSTANLIWSRISPLSNGFGIVYPAGEVNGSYYVLATEDTPTTNYDVPHLYKISASTGNLIWHAQYSDFISGSSYQGQVTIYGGRIIVTGRKDSINVNPVMIEIDSSGMFSQGQIYYLIHPAFFQLANIIETSSGQLILYGTGGDYSANLGGYILASVDSLFQMNCYPNSLSLIPPNYYQDTLIGSGSSFFGSSSLTNITSQLVTLSDQLSAIDFCNLVGVHQRLNEKDLLISPNPVNGQFVIDRSTNSINEIEIFNSLGEKVYSSSVNCTSCIVHCSSFLPGIYFVKAIAKDQILTQKFIKE